MSKENNTKGIVYSTDEVRAILDGKSQFRSVAKIPMIAKEMGYTMKDAHTLHSSGHSYYLYFDDESFRVKSEHQVGDILYVKEEFETSYIDNKYSVLYKADEETFKKFDKKLIWRPAEDMEERHARIFQKVTAIRVERLQDSIDITNIEESGFSLNSSSGGFVCCEEEAFEYALTDFINKWDSEHEDGEKWSDNPYVIVEDRERVEKP